MGESKCIKYYYNIDYKSSSKLVEFTSIIINGQDELIFKSSKGFKAKDIQDAEGIGIYEALNELNLLEAEEEILEEESVIIFSCSRTIPDVINYRGVLKKDKISHLDNILLEFQWHKNWQITWKADMEQEILRILNEYSKKMTSNHKSKREAEKVDEVEFSPIHELIQGKNMQILFFDLEMNCNQDWRKLNGSEIISIGAVKYGIEDGIREDKFYSLIKPTNNPVLSERCMNITGIEQKEIDGAESFDMVMNKFTEWIGDLDRTLFVSWSDEDIRAIKRDYRINKGNKALYSAMNSNYSDFQLEFSKYMNSENRFSLTNALGVYSLNFNGQQHNAGYDALNLALLYETYIKCLEQKDDEGLQGDVG